MCISVCAFNKYAFKIIFIFCNINYIQQTNECNTYMHAYYIYIYIYLDIYININRVRKKKREYIEDVLLIYVSNNNNECKKFVFFSNLRPYK
jgi:hypothetical protein